jgi:hypothetical protein
VDKAARFVSIVPWPSKILRKVSEANNNPVCGAVRREFFACAAFSVFARGQIGAQGAGWNEKQPAEAGALPGWVVVRELLKWRAVRSLKQRLVEREAWVHSLGLAWGLRAPVRENDSKVRAVNDAVAVEVSAAREAVAGGCRWNLCPFA